MRLTASLLTFTRESAFVISATRRTDTPCRSSCAPLPPHRPSSGIRRSKTSVTNSSSRSLGTRSCSSLPTGVMSSRV
jgi:hypothetical protein